MLWEQAVSMLSVYEKKIGIACALLIMVLAVHHCLGISVVGEEQLRLKELARHLRGKFQRRLTSGNYL